MKKIIISIIMILSLFILSGCSNKNEVIEEIIDTKEEVEEIAKDVVNSKLFINPVNSNQFENMFTMYGRDLMLDLEEMYNEGTKIVLLYSSTDEVNDKVIGENKENNRLYHIYIGSKDHSDIWSYGTVDLDTGNITWEDSY